MAEFAHLTSDSPPLILFRSRINRMRFSVLALLLVAVAAPACAFLTPQKGRSTTTTKKTTAHFSTVLSSAPVVVVGAAEAAVEKVPMSPAKKREPLNGAEINARLAAQLDKLRQKDATSPQLSGEDLSVLYQDDHIIVIDKPSGVLAVSGSNHGKHSLAQAVYDTYADDITLADADRMVVHRLGMDTSGVMVFCKTLDAVRGLNASFRSRSVERSYEALVCGHVKRDTGLVDLPLMRDYEFPPFMRVATDEHQEALLGLDPDVVGKKLLEFAKESLTQYKVIERTELGGQPVTRVTLTSISGRTHQLNCHMAAFGHPIVGDTTYGIGGDAANNGGLTEDEQKYLIPNKARASVEEQQGANDAAEKVCCHAKSIKFRHPVTKEEISLSAEAPF